jgi:hypothetical protein
MINKTNYKVLSELKKIGEKVLSEVDICSVWSADETPRKYPFLVIDADIKQHIYKQGVTKLNIVLYFVDKVKVDNSNELDVKSDMVEIMKHYVDYVSDVNESEGFYLNKGQGEDLGFLTFADKWNDLVAGVRVDIQILIPDGGKGCENMFI